MVQVDRGSLRKSDEPTQVSPTAAKLEESSFAWSNYPAALCALALGTFNFGVMIKEASCIGVPVSLGFLLMKLLPPICVALLLGYLIKLGVLLAQNRKIDDLSEDKSLPAVAAGAMCLMGLGSYYRAFTSHAVIVWGLGVGFHLLTMARFLYVCFAIQGAKNFYRDMDISVVVPCVGIAAGAVTGGAWIGGSDMVRKIAWLCEALGVFWVIMLVPLMAAKMLNPYSAKSYWSVPAAGILAAPISLCSTGWLTLASHTAGGALNGRWQLAAHILAYSSIVVATPVLCMMPKLLSLRFTFGWASYTFPTAITAISAIKMFKLTRTTHWLIIAYITAVLCAIAVLSAWIGSLRQGIANLFSCCLRLRGAGAGGAGGRASVSRLKHVASNLEGPGAPLLHADALEAGGARCGAGGRG
jgi:tellurite resistance protein TehA-like permease